MLEELFHYDGKDITPWHIFTEQERHLKSEGLKKRYPNKLYAPFAYRQDNDDVACLFNGKVLIIHDYASPGWEARKNISLSINEWLEMVLEEHNFWIENDWI